MIYLAILLLFIAFLISLNFKNKFLVSTISISALILSMLMLTISLAPEIRSNMASYSFFERIEKFGFFPYDTISTIIYLLILILIIFHEITSIISFNDSHTLEKQKLVLLISIFSGIIVFSNNIFIVTVMLFAIPISFFFSKTIKDDAANFSYVFWNILGAISFLCAIFLMIKTLFIDGFTFSDIFNSYFFNNEYTNLKNFHMNLTTLISLLFFFTILIFNTLFPLGHSLLKRIDTYKFSELFMFFVPNLIFLSIIIKLKNFNPLLSDLIPIYLTFNIIINSLILLETRSLKKLIFITSQIIISFSTIGIINFSHISFKASIYLISCSTLILTCLLFTLCFFERNNIITDTRLLNSKTIIAPKACFSLTLLLLFFTLPIGPYFIFIITILNDLSKANDLYVTILPLTFVAPSIISLYLIYKLFFSSNEVLNTKDISFFDLSPILPLLVIMCLIIIQFLNFTGSQMSGF